MTASKDSSSKGTSVTSPRTNSTPGTCSRANSSMASERSSPTASAPRATARPATYPGPVARSRSRIPGPACDCVQQRLGEPLGDAPEEHVVGAGVLLRPACGLECVECLGVVAHRSGPPMPGSPSTGDGATMVSSPASRHASKPPTRSATASGRCPATPPPPSSTSTPRGRRGSAPASLSVSCGFEKPESGSTRHSSTDRGTCTEPGITPSRARSSCERRSTITLPFSERSCASRGS